MGPYCQYCDSRCFLPRVLKDGRSILLATCGRGMANDLRACGETHETALNPVTQTAEVEALVRALRGQLETLVPHTQPEPGWTVRCQGREAGGRAIGGTVCLWKVDHPEHAVTAEPEGVCGGCGQPIGRVGTEWAVTGTGTSADGLTYCPPDPDALITHRHHYARVAVT